MQGAILVSCSVHRVLNQVAGSIDTTFVQLGTTNDLMSASQTQHKPLIKQTKPTSLSPQQTKNDRGGGVPTGHGDWRKTETFSSSSMSCRKSLRMKPEMFPDICMLLRWGADWKSSQSTCSHQTQVCS